MKVKDLKKGDLVLDNEGRGWLVAGFERIPARLRDNRQPTFNHDIEIQVLQVGADEVDFFNHSVNSEKEIFTIKNEYLLVREGKIIGS